jgi:hypothetical protein
MKFDDRITFKKAILVYKSIHNECPEYMLNKFETPQNLHSMALRSKFENALSIPKPNYEFLRKSLSYSGAKIWNSLPSEIRLADSISQFKTKYLRWKFVQRT